ncbi:MAG: protein kinase [Acidobacteriota bacterium]
MIGDTISHYRVLSRLGSGGMGEVYLAEDARLGRKVAIKFLRTESIGDENAKKRLVREARAAATLDHPNICAIYEVGHEGSRTFIVMQYIEGETLAERIERKPLDLIESARLAEQIADALNEAHSHGIIHRDLKPMNIMITARGQAKLMDFGLAKLVEGENQLLGSHVQTRSQLTSPGSVVGTVPYMSPEQIKSEELDARSDLFSLGTVLYEMIAGSCPFSANTGAETIGAILFTAPPALSTCAPGTPAEAERIVNQLLAKEKSERYQTAAEVLTDLRRLIEELEFEARLRRSGDMMSSSGVATAVIKPNLPASRSASQSASASSGVRKRRSTKAIDSLAVMPLVNASNDPEMEYLSDGVTESIINKLAHVPKLRVMARASVFRYKGRDLDPQQIGRELNVRAVLTGRVMQRGEKLTIGIELSDAENGAHIWGEQYNRTSPDIFELEDEISRVISEHLRLKLTSREKKQMTRRYTENPEVYKLYLNGRYHYNKLTGDGMKRAIDYYQQAIAMEPNYAPAYAGLSYTFVTLWWYGFVSPDDAVPQARAATMKALEIDPRLSDAHTALGRIRQCYDWQWEEAEKEFKRAIKLNPNSSDSHLAYATFLGSMCRFDQARAEGKRTLELDPLSLSANLTLGWTLYYFTREYDQAIEHGRKMLDMEPNFYGAHWLISASLNLQGKFEEALASHQQAIALGGGSHVLAGLGSVYARWGKRDEALKVIDELKELMKRTYIPAYQIAMVYGFLGDKDPAFEWLEKAYRERNGTMAFLKTDHAMDNLKGDPRLTDLMQRLGLN